MTKTRDSEQRRSPVGNGAEIINKPSQRRLRLGERAGRHHEAAERNLSREIQGGGNEYRRDNRNPAEARATQVRLVWPHTMRRVARSTSRR